MYRDFRRRTVRTDYFKSPVAAQNHGGKLKPATHARQRRSDQKEQNHCQPCRKIAGEHGSGCNKMSQRLDRQQAAGWFEGNGKGGGQLHRRAESDPAENQ